MAKAQYDIITDDTDDLATANGDFVTGESTQQHMRHLLLCAKGDFKQNPTTGVGAFNYLDDDGGQTALIREIAAQYSADGMSVQQVGADKAGKIIVNASY